MQRVFDEDYPAHELRYYWKSVYMDELSDAVIDRIVELAAGQPSPLTTVDIWSIGGAVRHVDEDATAFGGRRAPFMVNVESNWRQPEDDAVNVQWTRHFINAMRQFPTRGQYFNFPGFLEEGMQMLQATYGAKYERLVALKQRYDPNNLFRLNHNVRPAA